MRMIDADTIVHYQTYDDEHEEFQEHESTIADFLDEMTDEGCPKPVDAVPVKHGRWKRNENGTYSCSECQSWIPNEQKHYANFCLYCGADMRGKQ